MNSINNTTTPFDGAIVTETDNFINNNTLILFNNDSDQKFHENF